MQVKRWKIYGTCRKIVLKSNSISYARKIEAEPTNSKPQKLAEGEDKLNL